MNITFGEKFRLDGVASIYWARRTYQMGWRRPVSDGMRYALNDRRARGVTERRQAANKSNTVTISGNEILKQRKLRLEWIWEIDRPATVFSIKRVM